MYFLQSFFLSSASGESSNGEWEKIDEVDGITGYIRSTSESSVNEIKAIGVVDAPVAVIEPFYVMMLLGQSTAKVVSKHQG